MGSWPLSNLHFYMCILMFLVNSGKHLVTVSYHALFPHSEEGNILSLAYIYIYIYIYLSGVTLPTAPGTGVH